MNSRSNIIAGLFIAIGLMLLGVFINKGIKSFKMYDRSVAVKGLSEREVPANRVIWPIAYTEVGNDLQTVYSTIERKNAIIIEFLTRNGVNPSEINSSAPIVEDRQVHAYGGSNYVYRYNIRSVVTVSSDKTDLVRNLISKQSELVKNGIAVGEGSWEHRITYQYTNINDIKPQMIEEATKNARISAEKFANDSGSKLGKIKSATQGQFSIDNRDENTPHIKVLRVVTTIEYMLED